MTSPLVPTPVVDRNGRLTTVHKRADQPVKNAATIPAPVAAVKAQPSKAKLVSALADAMDDVLYLDEPEQKDYLIENLEAHDADFLANLQREMGNGNDFIPSTLVNDHETKEYINEVLRFADHTGQETFPETCALIRSLHLYPQLPNYPDFSEAPEEVQEQCIALMKTANAVANFSSDAGKELETVAVPEREDVFVLRDDALVQAVLAAPENAERLITVIEEQRTGRFAVIDAYLNGGTSPMVSGVL